MKSSRMRAWCSELVGLALLLVCASACVTGQRVRNGPEDVAAGPKGSAAHRALEQTGTPVTEQPARESRPGHVWVKGYYHWDGVKYVWLPGRWEAAKPGYRWSALTAAPERPQ